MKGPSVRLTPEFTPKPYLPVYVSFDLYVQAAARDSMTLLKKKLDQLQDEIQEVQSANSAHSDATKDAQEQSTMVSQKTIKSSQFWCILCLFKMYWPKVLY